MFYCDTNNNPGILLFIILVVWISVTRSLQTRLIFYLIYFRTSSENNNWAANFVTVCHQKLAQYTLFCLCTYVIEVLQNNVHETFRTFDKFNNYCTTTTGGGSLKLVLVVYYIVYICCLMQKCASVYYIKS